MVNPYQTWVLTNQGAVDFVTMKFQWPMLVNAVLQLQREVAQLKADKAKGTLPGME